jgi:hypothetical protein
MGLIIPRLDTKLFKKIFEYHIQRRQVDVLFRGVVYSAAASDPSLQRKTNQAGYIQEVSDMEIMLTLNEGAAKPVAHSTDEVRIYDPQRAGAPRTYTDYRIVNVQIYTGPDCYQLTLTKRNA